MISQLNARLISSRVTAATPSTGTSGYASSGSDQSRSSRRSSGSTSNLNRSGVPEAGEASSTGSSNGYVADHSTQPSMPCQFNGSESMKRSKDVAGVSLQPALKRLRTNYNNSELNYLASKAKEVMEQAGLVYPKVQANTARMFPPKSGVDMTGVTHKYSSECDSPFLVESNKFGSNYMSCPYEMTSLLQSTSSYYSLVMDNTALPASFSKVIQMIQKNNLETTTRNNNFEKDTFSDTESSTSSVTVSDIGGVNCPPMPHLQDIDGEASVSQRVSCTNSASNVTLNEDQPSMTTSAIITIGTALEISRRPRIITSAQAPFNVVQVNAAFLRLSQSKSTNDFLGKPLQDVLLPLQRTGDNDVMNQSIQSLKKGLKTCNTTMQKVSVAGYPNLLENTIGTNPTNVRRISITPVGVPPKTDGTTTTDGKVTHMAIKLSIHSAVTTHERSRPASTSSSTSSMCTANHHSTSNDANGAIHVMG